MAGARVTCSDLASLLVDFDGDGRLDLIQTNGHVLDRARLGTSVRHAADAAAQHAAVGSRMSPARPARGLIGRSWVAGWRLATSMATAGPTWSSMPSTRLPPCLRNTSAVGITFSTWISSTSRSAGCRCSRTHHGRRPSSGRRGQARGKLSERIAKPVVFRTRSGRTLERIEVTGPGDKPNAGRSQRAAPAGCSAHRAGNRTVDAVTVHADVSQLV